MTDEQNIPFAVWEGQRIIKAESMAAVFERMERNEPINLGELERFTKWQCAK